MMASPICYPASPFDIFNVSFERFFDPAMHRVIVFDGALDAGILREATMQLIGSNPYLGSRFAEDGVLPVWEAIPEVAWAMAFSVVTGAEDEPLPRPPPSIDPRKGPQVRVRLYRRSDGDTLSVTCHHGFCDAGGLGIVTRQLLAIYRNLIRDPGYCAPLLDPYDRGMDQILELFTEDERREALRAEEPFIDRWGFPYVYTGRGEPRIAYRTFPQERLAAAKAFGREHGATVNDILIGCYVLALKKIRGNPSDNGEPRSIMSSADLRRHHRMDTGDLPRNSSVSFQITLSLDEDAGLADIIGEVTAVMGRKKQRDLGLACILFYETLLEGGMPAVEGFFDAIARGHAEEGLKNPVFSNLGIADPDDITGGEDLLPEIRDIQTLPCVCWPYGFLLVASTFRGRLTLMTGYEEGPYATETVERFLGCMDAYLPG
ncbi:condensation protein [Methanocalculus chunghsingensis]|uniref:Condensation protein n=2 Tax=Methanocalculus chunghsingensis TaxID=156457 RepID=A0A8J7W5R4_9EURY|nr:condensation protein [Methanocalculus chunghsingensis]